MDLLTARKMRARGVGLAYLTDAMSCVSTDEARMALGEPPLDVDALREMILAGSNFLAAQDALGCTSEEYSRIADELFEDRRQEPVSWKDALRGLFAPRYRGPIGGTTPGGVSGDGESDGKPEKKEAAKPPYSPHSSIVERRMDLPAGETGGSIGTGGAASTLPDAVMGAVYAQGIVVNDLPEYMAAHLTLPADDVMDPIVYITDGAESVEVADAGESTLPDADPTEDPASNPETPISPEVNSQRIANDSLLPRVSKGRHASPVTAEIPRIPSKELVVLPKKRGRHASPITGEVQVIPEIPAPSKHEPVSPIPRKGRHASPVTGEQAAVPAHPWHQDSPSHEGDALTVSNEASVVDEVEAPDSPILPAPRATDTPSIPIRTHRDAHPTNLYTVDWPRNPDGSLILDESGKKPLTANPYRPEREPGMLARIFNLK